MTVSDSDRITESIRLLRENVYCNDAFIDQFTEIIKTTMPGSEVKFVADRYGGWIVEISLENYTVFKAETYVPIVSSLLMATVCGFYKKAEEFLDIRSNLFNLTITGPCSITIKI